LAYWKTWSPFASHVSQFSKREEGKQKDLQNQAERNPPEKMAKEIHQSTRMKKRGHIEREEEAKNSP
jgi:hypothetical protein